VQDNAGLHCEPAQGAHFALAARLRVTAGFAVQDASCSARRVLGVVREDSGARTAFQLASPWRLRDGAGRTLAQGHGQRTRLFARADGSAVAVWPAGEQLTVAVLGARGGVSARFRTAWQSDAPLGTIAPWDAHAALVALPEGLAVAGAAGVRYRAYTEGLR